MAKRKYCACLCVWIALGITGGRAWSTPQDQATKNAYSQPEYNAYEATVAEKDPASKIKLLDDFVSKYAHSALLPYAYRDYYIANYALKNYLQTLSYIDKLLALDNVDLDTRMRALTLRTQIVYSVAPGEKTLQTAEAYTKARNTASEGLQILDQWQKPVGTSDADYTKTKKAMGYLFNVVAGMAAVGLKDFKGAETAYKAALLIDPDDAVAHYRLGVAFLQDSPAQFSDGYWELSRAIALKVPSADQVKAYLRGEVLRYQQPSCDQLVDGEIDNLIMLASTSSERPTSLTIPSADDLMKAREDTENFIPWLKEGGDHGKVMWLATCGAEYQDVPVKVIENTSGDTGVLVLKAYRPAATDPDGQAKEMEAATVPNMEIRVSEQPDARRIQQDDEVRFTGTLAAYNQAPFLLTWNMAKINVEDIPEQKTPPGPSKRRTLPTEK